MRALSFVLIVQLYESVQVLNKFMFLSVLTISTCWWGAHEYALGETSAYCQGLKVMVNWSYASIPHMKWNWGLPALQRHVEHVVISVEEVTETFPQVQMMVRVILKLVEVAGFEV
jgi:hypothetical protein